MSNTNGVLICGDIAWGLTGNPATSVTGSVVVGAAARSTARRFAARPVNKAKVSFAATLAAKAAASRLAQQRAALAKKRLATKPAPAKRQAWQIARELHALPAAQQTQAVQALAQHAVAPVTTTDEGNEVLPPEAQTEQTNEALENVADAVWAQSPHGDDGTATDTDTEEETDEDEPELDDESEVSGDCVGWNPFKAIKNVVKSKLGKVALAAATGGLSVVASNKRVQGIAKAAVKSKLVMAAASGVAILCPAIGVPAVAALAIAAKVATAIDSVKPEIKAAATAMVKATAAAAKSGNKDAERGIAMIALASNAKKAQALNPPPWKAMVVKAILNA
jgi:hypothetical protein